MRARPEPRRVTLATALALLLAGTAAAQAPTPTLRDIAIAEDQRQFAPILAQALASSDPALRARAALAVGRLQDSTTVGALSPLLGDARPEVRREAVFALGQIGHRSARPTLEQQLTDRDPEIVILAAEALGKLGDKAATPRVTALLSSGSARLRATAAVALWRLADSTALEPLLARHQDPDPEVRWRVIYALEKIVRPERIVPIAAQHLSEDDAPLARAYAARTLGRQKSPRGVAYLLQALDQPDVAVKINAVRALQLIGDTTCVQCGARLARLLGHAHPYVRVTAATALADRFALAAADSATRAAVVDSLSAHLADGDVATRAAAGRALLEIRGAAALPQVRQLFGDLSVYARTGVLEGLRHVPTRESLVPFFQTHLDTDHPLLERMTAADLLGSRAEPGSAEILRAGLADTSALFLSSCASALADMKDKASIPDLVAAYLTRGRDADPDARNALRDALRDLAGRAFADSIERLHPAPSPAPLTYPADLAEPPKARGAVLHTERGDVEWAFYTREAPQTVRNFVRLAKRGYFDGRVFHRVVPNFVIQDGDPTGTGSGGPGYTIRCEYNALHYGPGMVGMALSGKDTGGSQWFITHSPQPHLDGRYTIFAHVVRGMDVVQRITQGDHVYTVEILE